MTTERKRQLLLPLFVIPSDIVTVTVTVTVTLAMIVQQ